MKASELRVGNQTSLGVVNTIYPSEFLVIGDGGMYHSSEADIQPIPLTEKWLCSFGMYEYPHKMLDGVIKLRNGVYFFKYNDFMIAIHYVHQLQNLYFALTGEELIYTEIYEKGKQRREA